MLRKLVSFQRTFCTESPYSAKNFIDKLVKTNKVMLFMKGTRDQPMCGFSRTVVSLLEYYGVDHFTTFDVLSDAEVREEVKKYSDWPTIPQLYINQQFVGGCDILNEMHYKGEIEDFLENEGVIPKK